MKQTREMTAALPGMPADTDKTQLGFWVYIMTDCVLFACLFAVYAVLHGNTFGHAGPADIFKLPYVLAETIILLASSYACGLGMLALRRGNQRLVAGLFALTFLLGAAFLVMELSEFRHLVIEGHSWRVSGFLSAYFTLVGTHGLHITVGLLWMAVLLLRIKSKGFSAVTVRRLSLLSIFWHFLDVIWIFIFTTVYLFGVAGV